MSLKNSKLNINSNKDLKDKNQENSIDSNDNIDKENIKINPERQKSNLPEALKQTELFQGSASTLLQNTSYPKDHWVVLESILQRNGLAVKPTNFSLEVLGIYSIPDWWKKLEQSGAIDNWYYQVSVG